jgi:hypothetical protein
LSVLVERRQAVLSAELVDRVQLVGDECVVLKRLDSLTYNIRDLLHRHDSRSGNNVERGGGEVQGVGNCFKHGDSPYEIR